jgi:hypothetical protein
MMLRAGSMISVAMATMETINASNVTNSMKAKGFVGGFMKVSSID